MNCDECGKNPASLHFTKIINGEKTELHLCESCAQEKGEIITGGSENFSIHNLFSDLLTFDSPSSISGVKPQQQVRCRNCGLTYSQFSKSGRFGCSDCYQYFNHRLDSLLRRIHGNTEHSGKVPQRGGSEMKIKKEIARLKEELKHRIAVEEFEKAAEIRDRIRELENKIRS